MKADNAYIMTDGEEAFSFAIEKYFPKMKRYRDWGHNLKNAKRELKKLQITKMDQVDSYIDDLKWLFVATSETEYLMRYNEILSNATRWNGVSFSFNI